MNGKYPELWLVSIDVLRSYWILVRLYPYGVKFGMETKLERRCGLLRKDYTIDGVWCLTIAVFFLLRAEVPFTRAIDIGKVEGGRAGLLEQRFEWSTILNVQSDWWCQHEVHQLDFACRIGSLRCGDKWYQIIIIFYWVPHTIWGLVILNQWLLSPLYNAVYKIQTQFRWEILSLWSSVTPRQFLGLALIHGLHLLYGSGSCCMVCSRYKHPMYLSFCQWGESGGSDMGPFYGKVLVQRY